MEDADFRINCPRQLPLILSSVKSSAAAAGPFDPMGRRLAGPAEPRLRPLRAALRAGDVGGLGHVPLPHEQPAGAGLARRAHSAR